MALFGVITLLVGCASVSESYAPDGRKAYVLNCSGTARGWDKCFSKAGDLCQESGYDILDRTAETSASVTANNQGLYANQSAERSMVIACKAGK